MRYTPPYADVVAQDLKQRGIKEAVLFSMYPHFSYTTTASSMEDILRAFKAHALTLKIVQIERYYQERAYNLAVVERIKEALSGEDSKDFHLVFSAHSLPKRNIENGRSLSKRDFRKCGDFKIFAKFAKVGVCKY